MVLPIQSQLAHTSNTISVISLGLSNMSSVISSLGGLLSSAFATGLTAFNSMKSAMSGFFDEQIKSVTNLASALSSIAGGSGVIPDSTASAISSIAKGGLGTKLSGGSGINDMNRHLYKFTPKENTFRFPNLSHDGKQNHTSIFGGPARHTDFSDRVKMGMAMSGTTNITINVEASGITDSTDKTKLASDLGNIYADEILRRGGLNKKSGRLQ
tara:strand:- start:14526 stop:15164 length:639 start_codon:yes stop_codon:yes gene_type:complete